MKYTYIAYAHCKAHFSNTCARGKRPLNILGFISSINKLNGMDYKYGAQMN